MRKCLYRLALLCMGLTLSACGGGGGGGGDSDEEPVADISGTWEITETMGSNSCGEAPGTVTRYDVTVTMSGNRVTVVTPVGTFTGRIDGDELEWTGSYPEDGGTTTIEEMDLTVSPTGNTLSGSTEWSWTDGGFNCSGRTSISGVRTSAPPGGGGTIVDTEPNDTTATAQPVSGSSATITGNVSGNGYTPSGSDPFDAYAFTPSASRSYSISLNPSTDDADLEVYDVSLNLLGSSQAAGTAVDAVNVTLTAGQVYYVVVVAFTVNTGSTGYTITIN